MAIPTSATLPAIQAAELSDISIVDRFFSDDSPLGDEDVDHKPETRDHIRYMNIIVAAFIFIVIIAWVETLRKWIEYYYIRDETVYKLSISFTVHAMVITLISLVVIFAYTRMKHE